VEQPEVQANAARIGKGGAVNRRPPLQIAAAIVVLTVTDVLTRVLHGTFADLVVPAGALLVLGLSRMFGTTWAELGLARSTWRTGLRYAVAAAGAVVVVVTLAALLPLTRTAFLDDRYRNDAGAALRYALLAVPLLTVVPEELAFRGVLLALISKPYGRRAGTIWSSVLFGLWHITSSLGLSSDNAAVSEHLGTHAQVLGVVGAVLATTVAGLVFCWLRWRSGSLLAPIGLHWAVNGVAVLAAAAVWRLTG
jgi:membrane protease YdiL (CAAX protease family)